MIVNEELFQLEDQCLQVAEMIKKSKTMASYLEHKQSMEESAKVCQLKEAFLSKKEAFLSKKEAFENVAAYGEYAPDYREKKRAVRKAKRQLDMDEHVAAFRYSETQLQSLLDQIVQVLAEEVSNEIKVDAGSPFFETKKHFGCGGNCHAIRQ
ncbi:TPA: YlbF family regulator [Enterococcus faecium]|nr:YlbF family regulator [Enterococcus faecium]